MAVDAMFENLIRKEIELTERVDGDERQKAIDNVARLYELKIQRDKVDIEADVNHADKKSDAMEKYIQIGVGVLTIVVQTAFYNHWFKKSLRFEETGSITSSTVRNFFGKVRPGK